MKLNTYLAFKGNCEDAMNFYKDVLDGEFTTFMRFSEAPPGTMEVPESMKNMVMHVTLESRGCTLMASDNIQEHMKVGNNFSLSINLSDDEEASAVFNSLAEGGQVIMPYENAFWGGKFGMLLDKFGVQWMVSSDHKPA